MKYLAQIIVAWLLLANVSQAAIAFVSAGTATTGNSAAMSVAYPSSPAAGNLILCCIASKEPTSPSTVPAGMALLTSVTGVSGGAVGANAGPMTVYVYFKISDGTETGSVSFTVTGQDAYVGRMFLYSCTTNYTWSLSKFTSGEDSSSGTGYAVAGAAGIDLAANDYIVGIAGLTRGNATASAETFSATSAVFGTVNERSDTAYGSSPGAWLVVADAPVTTGNNNVPTYGATLSGASVGPAIILRLREEATGTLLWKWVGPAFTAAGTTNVPDESGNSRVGTLQGGDNTSTLQSTDRPGTAGTHSLHLNGSDDHITASDITSLMGDNASVMAWVKLDVATPAGTAQTGLWNTGAAIGGSATHHPYTSGVGYYDSFRITSNTTATRVDAVNLAAGGTRTNWHHVAVTTSPGASGWKLWIDGSQITSTTGLVGIYYDSDRWGFGQSSTGGFFFDGYVWDFRIYNKTLTSAELATVIAEKDSATPKIPPASLNPILSQRISPRWASELSIAP